MKRVLIVALVLVALLPVTLTTAHLPQVPYFPDPTPQKTQAEELSLVEQAIRKAIAGQAEFIPVFLIYDTLVDHLQISADGTWATAWLNPVDPLTNQVVPAEPGLAIAQKSGGAWQVYLPTTQGWSAAVEIVPEDLLSAEDKQNWLFIEIQSIQQAAAGAPFGGYLLPWAAGVRLYMTQSVHHDKYDSSGKAHYAFDFAQSYPSGMFNVYAARGGTVHRVVWWHPNGNEQYGNYLVLKDTSTSPTTYQLYLHFAQDTIPPALRVVGAAVQQGQFIGVADDTGISSGNHLHFHVHLNPNSYWDQSVDITFDDVTINGGRPRNAYDLAWCRNDSTFRDICTTTSETYVSGNMVKGDLYAPVGDIVEPVPGLLLESSTLRLSGWASDGDSGLKSAQFIAKYRGTWHNVGTLFNSSPFAFDWDLCADGVPDGPVSLALELRDQDGNWSSTLPGLRHLIKNYTCPTPPPACTPDANQVAIYARPDYLGECVLLGTGSYPFATSLGSLGNDNAESIRTGANVRATLYMNENLAGRGETFFTSDNWLVDNLIGTNRVSSVLVQPIAQLPGVPAPAWPEPAAAYPAGSSLSLVWQDTGGADQFQALLSDSAGTVTTSTWLEVPIWNLGSLPAGSYTWQVKARNNSGESGWSAARSLNLSLPALPVASPVNAPYSDDMEISGDNGWTKSSNWDKTDTKNHTDGGKLSWMYDTSSAVGYDTGTPNTGDLTTRPLRIPSGSETYSLRFWYYYQTEGPGPFWDQRWVQLSVDGGPFINRYQLSEDPANYWLQSPPISLAGYNGRTVQVRFHFETLDEASNGYAGWFIDDFKIDNAAPPSCADNDNSPQEATAVVYGSTSNGRICPNGDFDFFKFNGNAGDLVGISVDTPGVVFDPYLLLLDSSGTTLLAENDDRLPGTYVDPLLTYRLPKNGTYYLKVRAWKHPSTGGLQSTYKLSLHANDEVDPSATISSPPGGTFLPATPFTITVAASDESSGIHLVDFLWHSGDWQGSDWKLLGTDDNGSDGWNMRFNPADVPDQKEIAFYARVYDWVGNWIGAGAWNLALDRTAPVTALEPLAATQNRTAILLEWTGSDNLSGIEYFDLQRRRKENSVWKEWQDLFLKVDKGLRQIWMVGESGGEYGFRLRGVDRIGNTEAYPADAETSTRIPVTVCSPAGDEWENDNSSATASLVTVANTSQLHTYCNPAASDRLNDEDWLKISVKASQPLSLIAVPQDASAASVLELYDAAGSAGTLLASSSPAEFGETSLLSWLPAENGPVFLRMRHLDGRVAGDGVKYLILVRQGPPVFLPMMRK